MPIPPHRADGTLPPVADTVVTRPEAMTPFPVTLEELIRRFGTSRDRVQILDGFIGFRERLHQMGLVDGFQWIGGGFIEQRPEEPRDIDVVTFYRKSPEWMTRAKEEAVVRGAAEVFTSAGARARYGCDAYFVDLSHASAVRWIVHWCGVHSHHAVTRAWKGFLEVPLAPDVAGDFWVAALAEARERFGSV